MGSPRRRRFRGRRRRFAPAAGQLAFGHPAYTAAIRSYQFAGLDMMGTNNAEAVYHQWGPVLEDSPAALAYFVWMALTTWDPGQEPAGQGPAQYWARLEHSATGVGLPLLPKGEPGAAAREKQAQDRVKRRRDKLIQVGAIKELQPPAGSRPALWQLMIVPEFRVPE